MPTIVSINLTLIISAVIKVIFQEQSHTENDIPVSFIQSAFFTSPGAGSFTSPFVQLDGSPKEPLRHPCQPRHIHLSLGDENRVDDTKTSIIVSFSITSFDTQCSPDQVLIRLTYGVSTPDSNVEHGITVDVMDSLVTQYNHTSPRTGEFYTSDWLYHVPLTGLEGNMEHWYFIKVYNKDEVLVGNPLLQDKNNENNIIELREKYLRPLKVSHSDLLKMKTLGRSKTLSFVTAPTTSTAPIPSKFMIVGDLGQTYNSSMTMRNMLHETKYSPIGYSHEQNYNNATPATLVMIAGDLSYSDSVQSRWDSWFELIEPLISTTPLVITAGNHDIECDTATHLPFLPYENRFRVPNRIADGIISPVDEKYFNSSSSDYHQCATPSGFLGSYDYGNAFYSFNYGLAHVVVLSSYSDTSVGSVQYQWLIGELEKIDRLKTPWLIVMMHTQFYTTFEGHKGELETTIMRKSMEPLFVKHNVNLVFSGHDHGYMRSKSMVNGTVDSTGLSPVYLIVGAGGNREGHSRKYLNEEPEEWVNMRDKSVFGFGTLEVINASIANWKWIINGEDSGFLDDYWFRNQYYEEKFGIAASGSLF